MAGSGLLELAAAGVPGIALAGYAVHRLIDRLVFLAGLRMVLRETRREDRVAAISAYTDGMRRRRRRVRAGSEESA